MEGARESGKPFFVYIPPNAPHGPYHDVPEDLLQYYQSADLTPILKGNASKKHQDTVARVFAMVENIDQNIGKLDDYLRKSGQFENTLVMFFTDNGPNTMRHVGPFRGMKSHVHEGGIRTMCYARWPQQFKAGTKSDRIAAHIDIFPTMLEVAGVGDRISDSLDGRSLLPLLEGKSLDWPNRRLFIQSHRGNEPVKFHHFAVREQDWKLVRGTGFGGETIREEKPFELYQIAEDPGETKNLAESRPEKVAELKEAYLEWFADVSSTRPNNYDAPRIVIGSEAEPVSDLSIQDWRVPAGAQGWGTGGKWMVRFASGGPYRVSVLWDQEMESQEVTLLIDEKEVVATLVEGATEIEFRDVKVAEGDATISVQVGGKLDKNKTPRFVRFSLP